MEDDSYFSGFGIKNINAILNDSSNIEIDPDPINAKNMIGKEIENLKIVEIKITSENDNIVKIHKH